MHAPIHSTPRLCRDDGMESARAVMLEDFDRHLGNLQRCIHWLTAEGVATISVTMKRGPAKPRIVVAGSSYLHQLFRADCANTGRRQEGALTIYTWQAVRYGCDVVWEETCAS